MRYNERELVSLAGQPCQRQARVQMRAWAAGKREGYKERNIKLVMNFLFYFRVDETEPVGALVLEECEVERNSLPNSNCFSLVYRGGTEQRYCFVCSSISECDEWMKLLARARIPWSSTGSRMSRDSSWHRGSSDTTTISPGTRNPGHAPVRWNVGGVDHRGRSGL
ncbi:pleckstrin homology domain-containing family J member 1 isoform X1 [Petromyzon marinus]|uniref:Pleckstrin homology domain-containing family J member 1 isoform X1 n=1 Tax=Petromyzon marinus TaxID=7757 RepID=A0AAJ7XB02_PETMA|nr:pleckstrin homology domain-containing family J member 1 isoform X1 [Petromyzon marinus]